jgi:DNA-binding transcriptional MerR regulator
MNYQEQAITIQQVSQKLDVPKPTLRFWEREFVGILVPLRTNGGQRRYAPEHISVIEEIKMLKKAGLSLVEIKRKMGKGIDDLLIGRFDDWEKERDGGLMSKAGGLMSKAGSLKSRNGRTDGIDLLAERVAEVVKMEVLRFFQGGEG